MKYGISTVNPGFGFPKRKKRSGIVLWVALLAAASAAYGADPKPKEMKVKGYITALRTPTDFDIDAIKVRGDSTIPLDVEMVEPDAVDQSQKDTQKDEKATIPKVQLDDIRVGTELELEGMLDPATQTLQVKKWTILYEDRLRPNGEAILESVPALTRRGNYWEGDIRVDGQRIHVNETTVVKMFPSKADKKATKEAAKKLKQKGEKAVETEAEQAITAAAEAPGQDLTQAKDLKPNMMIRYWGVREKESGVILAKKVEFRSIETGLTLLSAMSAIAGEKTPDKAFKLKAPNYEKNKYGLLSYNKMNHKLIPARALQEYVDNFGKRLVPMCQQTLPNDDIAKIPFRFLVMEDKNPNAYVLPGGTVMISTAMIRSLDSPSQLAFILAHEIAHSTQRHVERENRAHAKKRVALKAVKIAGQFTGGLVGAIAQVGAELTEQAIVAGYRRGLENQADRVALEYMTAAGFDPREGPGTWKTISSKFGDAKFKSFWATHDTNTERRSYLINELRQNFSDVDFSQFQLNGDEVGKFIAAKTSLDESTQSKKKRKKS